MVMINNLIIAGDYVKKVINQVRGKPYVQIGLLKSKDIIPKTVQSYQIVTTDVINSRKEQEPYTADLLTSDSRSSAMAAKSKGLKIVSVLFMDGTKILAAVDDKMYELIKKSLATL